MVEKINTKEAQEEQKFIEKKRRKSSKIAPKTAPETFVEGSWYQDWVKKQHFLDSSWDRFLVDFGGHVDSRNRAKTVSKAYQNEVEKMM